MHISFKNITKNIDRDVDKESFRSKHFLSAVLTHHLTSHYIQQPQLFALPQTWKLNIRLRLS